MVRGIMHRVDVLPLSDGDTHGTLTSYSLFIERSAVVSSHSLLFSTLDQWYGCHSLANRQSCLTLAKRQVTKYFVRYS